MTQAGHVIADIEDSIVTEARAIREVHFTHKDSLLAVLRVSLRSQSTKIN